jgi:hypothetical protein
MLNRIMRAFRLDATLFREVAENPGLMNEATIIVVVVTLLSALGGAIGLLFAKASFGSAIVNFFVTWIVAVLIGWIGWAILTYFVGTALFKGKTDIPEMMRVLGYASAPRLLGIFGIIPCLGWIASLIGAILAFIAGFIAVREAMEFDTGKAIVTVLISWVIAFAITFAIGLVVAGTAAVATGLGG